MTQFATVFPGGCARPKLPLRALCILTLVAALAACATVAPEHAAALTDAQRLADAAVAAFGGPRVRVDVVDAIRPGVGAEYRNSIVTITAANLHYITGRAMLAHELAHVTLGHTHASTVDQARQWEMDANARAVEILMRVDGVTARAAASAVGRLITTVSLARAGRPLQVGQLNPCDEFRDLRQRYPGDWAKDLVCVETAP